MIRSLRVLAVVSAAALAVAACGSPTGLAEPASCVAAVCPDTQRAVPAPSFSRRHNYAVAW